jgi:hypothetical protein
VDDSIEKENGKEPLGNEKSPGRIMSLGIKFSDYGIAQFNEAFWDNSGSWVINNVEEALDRAVIKLISSYDILGTSWLDVETWASMLLGFLQEERSILEDLHQVPFQVAPTRPISHSSPDIENAADERIRAWLALGNQPGAGGGPDIGPPYVLPGVGASRVREARMNQGRQRIMTLERKETLNSSGYMRGIARESRRSAF